ncbi:MAG: hypothetical protein Q9217_001036 [Psora testacea]
MNQLSALGKQYPHICLTLVSRSKSSLYLEGDRTQSLDFSTWESSLATSTQPVLDPHGTVAYLQQCPGKAILIDNTSSDQTIHVYSLCAQAGISVVTPNKKAFSGTMKLWREIFDQANSIDRQDNGFVYHESTVGAGLPIISTLKDLVTTGDVIHQIEGVFSGTMSFLFNSFAPVEGSGGKWSEEVKKAKDAGYTEPDPRDDLNGIDVARKLVILARIAGVGVESIEAFPVQSLMPKELEDVKSGEEFMQRLADYDHEMEEVKLDACKEGKVVRFVGSIDVTKNALKVGLQKFDKTHPIAGLKGSDNIVSFYTERYGNTPLVIQGAGAGGAVTAMGVTADVIKTGLKILSIVLADNRTAISNISMFGLKASAVITMLISTCISEAITNHDIDIYFGTPDDPCSGKKDIVALELHRGQPTGPENTWQSDCVGTVGATCADFLKRDENDVDCYLLAYSLPHCNGDPDAFDDVFNSLRVNCTWF